MGTACREAERSRGTPFRWTRSNGRTRTETVQGDNRDPRRQSTGFQGRIALSHDGNFNDEDDWGAFPVAIAILDAFGVKDKLVHIEYNNIIQANDERFEREMTASVLGAAEKYGIPPAILHNCRTDLEGAVESIKNAVNASSPENPLYYVVAGPMDVPYRGILAADPAKRQYVYCISHSSWNDGYGKRRIEGRTKRDVIALGVKWIQVKPGNLLAYSGTPATKSTPAQWALFHWMRDSSDERLRWLFTRLEAEERCDVSDATMTYFLMTGDEQCDPQKLAALLDRKQKPDRNRHSADDPAGGGEFQLAGELACPSLSASRSRRA